MAVTSTSVPHGYHSTAITGQIGNLTTPQKWKLAAHVGEAEKDTLQMHEGASDQSFVFTCTDLSAGHGHVVQMRTASGFYQEGVRGASTFETNAKFEQRKFGQYGVLIGVHRHASSNLEAVETEYALDQEIKDGTAVEEGRWAGRRKFENGAMTIRERLPSVNRYFAGGRTLETLRSTDIFDRNQAVIANGMLKNLGGTRSPVRNGKQLLMRTLALAPSVCLTKLKLDPAYQQAVREGSARGADNPLFRGDVVDFDGSIFQEHDSFLHDGDGPVGSVFAPMGVLKGQTTVGGTAALSGICGDGTIGDTAQFDMLFGEDDGTNAEIFYTKWFPGFNYVFNEYGASSQDTLGSPHSSLGTSLAALPSYVHGTAGTTANVDTGGEHYLMVINPPNSVLLRDGSTYSVPNAIGFYAYTTGNNGKRITITARLASAASGQATGTAAGTHYRGAVTQLPQSINLAAAGTVANGGSATTVNALGYNAGVGIVTWGAGTYGGATLTNDHPVGSLVLPCNAKGVPFGYVPVIGAGGLCRAYGKHRLKRGHGDEEDGFVNKMFTRTYMGHRCRIDRAGRGKIVLVGCAIGAPELPLPVVTS